MVRGWRLAGASSVGTSHLSTGLPCQDRFAFSLISAAEGEVLVAVVADGAGSASQADVGALLATKTLVECVEVYFAHGGHTSWLHRDTAVRWIDNVAETLSAAAAASDLSSREYACTLLAVIAGADSTAFVQIGDGAIVVSHGLEDGWAYVFWPQHGEYANTTNFVIAADATAAMEFELAPRRIDEVALFSDGIEKLVLHDATRSVHEAFFNQMFPPVRRLMQKGFSTDLSARLGQYLSSPAVCERTDDDKTLVLATRRGEDDSQ